MPCRPFRRRISSTPVDRPAAPTATADSSKTIAGRPQPGHSTAAEELRDGNEMLYASSTGSKLGQNVAIVHAQSIKSLHGATV